MTEPGPGFVPSLPIFELQEHEFNPFGWPEGAGERPSDTLQPPPPTPAPPPEYDPPPGSSDLALSPDYVAEVDAIKGEMIAAKFAAQESATAKDDVEMAAYEDFSNPH